MNKALKVGVYYYGISDENEKLSYTIYDPEGDKIAVVYDEDEAEALLSHLNRL